ncbi:MAG: hypothetical protein IJG15_07955, partial [Lachnospiraceae bacterium]|nr:hypothetical protein [Lachnospiraceae bacterium]
MYGRVVIGLMIFHSLDQGKVPGPETDRMSSGRPCGTDADDITQTIDINKEVMDDLSPRGRVVRLVAAGLG